jgi:hypothetical protein
LVNYYSLNKQRKPEMMNELGVSSNLAFDANTADMKIKYWYHHIGVLESLLERC